MEGITYFRLESPYPGDVTKNCALTGNEVDSNFYVLEGRDVKSVTVLNDRIVLTLYNGDTISSGDVFSNYAKDLSFSFDSERGVLYITMNGETTQLNGFSTGPDIVNYNGMVAIASNEDFVGDGTIKNPLGLSPASKTGQYKPVIRIIDKTNGEALPRCNRSYGDRYITKEEVSDYGLLYPFSGVQSIATDLADANNGWRIPTKDDWDHMLDAVEPNTEHRDHTSSTQNKWLGQYAGKLLKTSDKWLGIQSDDETTDNENETCIDYDTDCFHNGDDCECTCCDQYLGEESDVDCGCSSGCGCGDCSTCNGINAFGFSVVPAGKADCYQNSVFSDFGYKAYYWTGSYDTHSNMAWIKEFDYNRCTVYQKAEVGQSCLSLRLVKDYDGTNYRGAETILGQTYPTVLVPSTDGDYKIWTSVNIALNNCCYHGIEPNAGVDITRTDTYFVNEWNGCRWIKYMLEEGDSIVVINDVDGKDVEYRVVDGVLVSVSDMIYNDVMEAIGNDYQTLNDKIDREILRSTEKDDAHDSAIAELNDALQAESEAREDADNQINDELERLDGDLEVEIAAREEGDTELRKEVLVTGEFVVEEGNLVLSKNDAEDVVIPFGHIFNFGTI